MKEAVEICIKDHTTQTFVKCGKVRNVVFEHGKSKETSVDAALVGLNPSDVDIDQLAILKDSTGTLKSVSDIGLKNIDLNESFIDEREIRTDQHCDTFSVGSASGYDQGKKMVGKELCNEIELEPLIQVYKDVANLKPKPSHICADVHVNVIIDDVGKLEKQSDRVCKFYKQISYKQNTSFKQGDSGTCIYVRRCNDQQYQCIGMAIANHPAGGCIATPMQAILEAFRLQ